MATVLEGQKYKKSLLVPKPDFEYGTPFSFFALFLTHMNFWLILIPFIAAFIGWLITWIAVKMLFHPQQAKKIAGISFHGVFPKRQQQFAEKLGKFAHKEFLSSDAIEQKINNSETLKKVMPLIEEHMDDFLRNRMKKEMPVIGMFVGDKTLENLKSMFMREIETLFPQVMKQYAANLKEEVNLEQIVIKKVANFSLDRLEKILSTELRWVKIMGAVMGFIIGTVQVLITLLIS